MPAALLRGTTFPLIDGEILQGRQKERAKPPASRVGLRERSFLEQVGEKRLGKILRVLSLVSTASQVRVQGIPVRFTQFRQRGFGVAGQTCTRRLHDAPVRGRESRLSVNVQSHKSN